MRCPDAAARAEHSRPAILLSMEPRPPDRGPGRIIFLNGASSSGKSTLAKAIQEALLEPFLHVSPDHLVASGMLPARRDPDGPFAWWQQMRPRFFDGFHRCLSALAAAGNDLIVEHIIEFRAWREDLATLPVGLDVFLVGVHCDLAEIDRRETRPERSPYRRGPVARGNRPDPHVRTLRLRGRHGERGPRRGCCICTDRLASPHPRESFAAGHSWQPGNLIPYLSLSALVAADERILEVRPNDRWGLRTGGRRIAKSIE